MFVLGYYQSQLYRAFQRLSFHLAFLLGDFPDGLWYFGSPVLLFAEFLQNCL